MSYHTIKIHKHNYNSPFKIGEEYKEFIDAKMQGNKIMAGVELADLLCAVKYQAKQLGLSLDDLDKMATLTEKVFQQGGRPTFSLFDYLKRNHEEIKEFGLGFIQVKLGNYNYNFYSEKIKKFKNYEEPHNHQQDFISEVIQGELIEKRYLLTKGDCHIKCVCGNPTVTLKNVDYKYSETIVRETGTLYFCPKEVYHSVEAKDGTVTKVYKFGEKEDAFAFGSIEKYVSILSKEDMWDIISDILK